MKKLREQKITLVSSKLLMCQCGLLASVIFLEPAKVKRVDKNDMDYTCFCNTCWIALKHEYGLQGLTDEIDNR